MNAIVTFAGIEKKRKRKKQRKKKKKKVEKM